MVVVEWIWRRFWPRVRGLLMFRHRNYSDRRTQIKTTWRRKEKREMGKRERGIICQIGEETQTATEKEKKKERKERSLIFLSSLLYVCLVLSWVFPLHCLSLRWYVCVQWQPNAPCQSNRVQVCASSNARHTHIYYKNNKRATLRVWRDII